MRLETSLRKRVKTVRKLIRRAQDGGLTVTPHWKVVDGGLESDTPPGCVFIGPDTARSVLLLVSHLSSARASALLGCTAGTLLLCVRTGLQTPYLTGDLQNDECVSGSRPRLPFVWELAYPDVLLEDDDDSVHPWDEAVLLDDEAPLHRRDVPEG